MHEAIAALKGIPTREELTAMLSQNIVEVTFDKLDGEERVMSCTLKENYIPIPKKDDLLSQTKIRNLEQKTLVVWDVTANAWRSFRYDRLKKAIPIDNPAE